MMAGAGFMSGSPAASLVAGASSAFGAGLGMAIAGFITSFCDKSRVKAIVRKNREVGMDQHTAEDAQLFSYSQLVVSPAQATQMLDETIGRMSRSGGMSGAGS